MKLWVLFFLSIVLAFWVIVRSGAKRSAIAGVILGLFIGQISFFEIALMLLFWTTAGFV
jgi:O-antigen ligase